MIRAVVIDRHPAMRAGLETILTASDEIVVVASTSGDPHELEHTLYRTTPDVVVLEDAPGALDGVELARLIKGQPPAPGVVLFSDGIEPAQVAAAMLAGADGLVDSRGDAALLVAAVRAAAHGEAAFPELDLASQAALALRLPSADRPILRMRLAAASARDIGRALSLDGRTLRARLLAMIERLRPAPA